MNNTPFPTSNAETYTATYTVTTCTQKYTGRYANTGGASRGHRSIKGHEDVLVCAERGRRNKVQWGWACVGMVTHGVEDTGSSTNTHGAREAAPIHRGGTLDVQ